MIRLTGILLVLASIAVTINAGTESSAPSKESVPLRVMSFNIRYGTARDGANAWAKRKDFLAQTISTFDPDLLGTQETLSFQRDFLAGKLDGYAVVAAGRDDGKEAGEMAALYYRKSRFEKVQEGHFWLSQTPDKPGSKGWDAALPRIATWVKLKDRTSFDSRPIFFLNTHFDHRGKKARQEAARLIRLKSSQLGAGCRLIITGDFNSAENSEAYRALFAEAEGTASAVLDTFRLMYPKPGREEGTFSGFKAAAVTGERIDWIACSRDWDVRLAAIDRTSKEGRTPSDHYPVTAVLRPKGKDQTSTIRVLCYNIHHGEGMDRKVNLPRLAKVIRDADPDLVALQEVDSNTRRTGKVDQVTELARLTGLQGKFGKAINYDGGEYGQAILSRYRIEKMQIHTLPGMPAREQRIALEAQVTINGRQLSFITTHLHHQESSLREQQAGKLNELFAKVDHPVILAGDLNATQESKPLMLLKKYWTPATASKELLSFPAMKPTKQIDFVLYRPAEQFQVLQAKVIPETTASDHRPVVVELRWFGKK